MALFQIQQNKISQLKNKQVLERSIQNLIEKNLEIALDIYFLQSEFPTSDDGRIDTIGTNKKNNLEKDKQTELPQNYSIEDHINNANEETKQIFLDLREKITSLDEEVSEVPKSKYIAYKTSTNFVDIVILHNSLKIFLNVQSGQLKDPEYLARDLTKPKPVGHWGNGDYEVRVDKNSDLEKIFNLIQQAYQISI